MLTVSVVMGTCNGARYLDEQLASIAAQSRLPLELVASDDDSDDETVSILRSFATRAPFEVRIVENSARLGFAANFLQAARLARGKLIAWSDQDDVWRPRKLARCAAEFDADPEVRLVVHSRQIGDRTGRAGRPLVRGGAIVKSSRLGRRRRVFTPESLPVQFAAPGFASVLDARVLAAADSLQATLPGAFGDYGHDTWTAFVAAALGKVVYLPEALAYYRQHERNLFGAPAGGAHRRRGRDSPARATAELARGNGRAELLDPLPGPGPAARAVMWRRYAEARARRLELYRGDHSRVARARLILAGLRQGDYGSRRAGRFGLRALLHDTGRLADGTPGQQARGQES